MTIHVVLPVHDRVEVTRRFVAALRAQRLDDWVLVLVDDGCRDGTVEMARSQIDPQRLVVLHGDGTLWWAGALQLAWRHLVPLRLDAADAVLIINDDVTVEPEFLSNGMAALVDSPTTCIQAIGVDQATGEVDRGAVADLVRLRFRGAAEGETPNCLSTRGLLMRADTFTRSGGFRPRWLPHYLSDYEYTLRLHRQGVPLRVDPRFTASVAFELTGLERPSRQGPRQFIADTFSNRAKFNPKHWSAFVIMACPPWVVPRHLAGIWWRFMRAFLGSMRPRLPKVAQ